MVEIQSKKIHKLLLDFSPHTIIFCSSLLIIIWSLPETIAFRNMMLFLGFFASLIFLQGANKLPPLKNSWPFFLFFGFFAWIIAHLLFFSTQFDFQITELKSLWMRSFLATPIGLCFGILLSDNNKINKKNFSIILFIALSGACSIFFSTYVYEVFVSGKLAHFNFYMTPYKAKTPLVIGIVLFLPLCLILIAKPISKPLGIWVPFIGLTGALLCAFVGYFGNTKNGIAIFVVGVAIFFINIFLRKILRSPRKSMGIFILFVSISLTSFLIKVHLDQNSMWKTLYVDLKTDVDIDHHNYWKNRDSFELPKNELGILVNSNSYERIAWFTAGIRLLKDNPMGFGLIHHSFGWLALARWPDFYRPNGNLRGATHSGWLDMALGVGIPGILLIWIPLFTAWYRSLFQEGLWFSYTSWTIPLIFLAYLTSETAGAHFTEMLFFMTAFFCGITLYFPARRLHQDSK